MPRHGRGQDRPDDRGEAAAGRGFSERRGGSGLDRDEERRVAPARGSRSGWGDEGGLMDGLLPVGTLRAGGRAAAAGGKPTGKAQEEGGGCWPLGERGGRQPPGLFGQ